MVPRIHPGNHQSQPQQKKFAEIYLSGKQAVEKLGVSQKTLQAWRLRGDGLYYVRISCRCVRYAESVLDAWMAARTVGSTSYPGGRDLDWIVKSHARGEGRRTCGKRIVPRPYGLRSLSNSIDGHGNVFPD